MSLCHPVILPSCHLVILSLSSWQTGSLSFCQLVNMLASQFFSLRIWELASLLSFERKNLTSYRNRDYIWLSFEGNIFNETSGQPVGEVSQNCDHKGSQLPGLSILGSYLFWNLLLYQSYLKFEIPFLWGVSQLVSLDSLSFLCILASFIALWGSFGIIADFSHLIAIESILLKIKIDAVVKCLDGPLLLLHHHHHHLSAPPATLSHHSKSPIIRFLDSLSLVFSFSQVER